MAMKKTLLELLGEMIRVFGERT